MKFGIEIQGGEPRTVGDLASAAEQAGWDGVFIADALAIGVKGHADMPWFDTQVALAVIAMRTERIQIGTLIVAVTRRRPWKLAREIMTLDHLSGGRLILGVGLGAAEDDGGFFKVGEAMDLKVRAEIMDETLAILAGLWTGKTFSFTGKHYKVDRLSMIPVPVQTPRIPIWVPGVWPKEKSMQRALAWDGIIPQRYKGSPGDTARPEDTRAVASYVAKNRRASSGFDIIAGGSTPGKSRKKAADKVRPFADAGATWWIESVWSGETRLRARIKEGPPRID
jgi:alkanesulfonate monooxygenase SsuD/methylene tetrahydromethanopterin reductase-like flavin-dependent oxidoreductase (luciferase family)